GSVGKASGLRLECPPPPPAAKHGTRVASGHLASLPTSGAGIRRGSPFSTSARWRSAVATAAPASAALVGRSALGPHPDAGQIRLAVGRPWRRSVHVDLAFCVPPDPRLTPDRPLPP